MTNPNAISGEKAFNIMIKGGICRRPIYEKGIGWKNIYYRFNLGKGYFEFTITDLFFEKKPSQWTRIDDTRWDIEQKTGWEKFEINKKNNMEERNFLKEAIKIIEGKTMLLPQKEHLQILYEKINNLPDAKEITNLVQDILYKIDIKTINYATLANIIAQAIIKKINLGCL